MGSALISIHIATVVLTASGFVLRAFWMATGSPRLESLPSRVLPHVNDTVLFVTGVWLALRAAQYPFVHGWLTAKLIGLVIYIVLGALALRYAPTRALQYASLAGALIAIAYVAAVALTRSAWPIGAF